MSILGFFDVMTISSQMLGTIQIGVTITEEYNDTVQITEHPVESGLPLADYAFLQPSEVTITCGWSNADYRALLGEGVVPFDTVDTTTQSGYIDSVYSKLLALQRQRVPFKATTSRRQYENMLLKTLKVTNKSNTNAALMVTATLHQIRIATLQSTIMPIRVNQADPSRTAETKNAGSKQAAPATPSPGGSVAPK